MFRIRRVVPAVVTSLCLIASACAAPSGSESGPGASGTAGPSAPGSEPAGSASAEPTGPATVGLDEVASLKLDLDDGPDWPSELDGSLWILAPDGPLITGGAEPYVYRIDPETGDEQARVTVGGRLCQGMVAGFDALWVCADDGMLRIDPATNTVAAHVAFQAARVFARPAVSEDAVWSLAGNIVADSVVRIDPATNLVTATYPLGHVARALSYGSGALWATSTADGLLLRIDPDTGVVTEAVSDLPDAGIDRHRGRQRVGRPLLLGGRGPPARRSSAPAVRPRDRLLHPDRHRQQSGQLGRHRGDRRGGLGARLGTVHRAPRSRPRTRSCGPSRSPAPVRGRSESSEAPCGRRQWIPVRCGASTFDPGRWGAGVAGATPTRSWPGACC